MDDHLSEDDEEYDEGASPPAEVAPLVVDTLRREIERAAASDESGVNSLMALRTAMIKEELNSLRTAVEIILG